MTSVLKNTVVISVSDVNNNAVCSFVTFVWTLALTVQTQTQTHFLFRLRLRLRLSLSVIYWASPEHS
jgi:hypothetical protein